jgi:putative mycofactocin binding protein MftB
MAVALDGAYELHPEVALRPEPFGALAYHYGNRRLIFLRHRDIVRVVRALADGPSLAESLAGCGVETRRWPSFVRALSELESAEVIRARRGADTG